MANEIFAKYFALGCVGAFAGAANRKRIKQKKKRTDCGADAIATAALERPSLIRRILCLLRDLRR